VDHKSHSEKEGPPDISEKDSALKKTYGENKKRGRKQFSKKEPRGVATRWGVGVKRIAEGNSGWGTEKKRFGPVKGGKNKTARNCKKWGGGRAAVGRTNYWQPA